MNNPTGGSDWGDATFRLESNMPFAYNASSSIATWAGRSRAESLRHGESENYDGEIDMQLRAIAKKIPGARWAVTKLRGLRGAHEINIPASGVAHGPEGIRHAGHREYVGGLWQEIGRLQFDFLVTQGLQPHHYFLDVACGSLRGGIHFIPYLEEGHYLGIDKEADLIRAGIDQELGRRLYEEKRPVLIVDGEFRFERFGVRPDFALAQSLFTHLPSAYIKACLGKLRGVMADGGKFYATFFERAQEPANPYESPEPHDHHSWSYTRRRMEEFGEATGWRPDYIGQWNHPRNQAMILYRPK